MQDKAQTTVWVAIDGEAVGVIGIADPIKETTPEAVRELHAMDLKIMMCTGDNRRTAESVAHELHIDDFRAEVTPQEKIEIVNTLRSQGAVVAMAETESTTRRRWQPLTLELQWEPERMLPLKARASRW